MDRFIFHNGGMPIFLDDIKFLDNTYRETFKQLLHAFNLPNNLSCIISGCNITDTPQSYQISQGLVLLNGEILPAPAQVIAKNNIPGFNYYWKVASNYYAEGYKTLENGQTVPAWEQRIAKVEYGIFVPIYLPLFGAKRLLDYVNDYLAQNLVHKVENHQILSSSFFYPGWSSSPTKPLRMYKDLTGRVFLSGTIIANNPQSDELFQLPSAYKPSVSQTFLVHGSGPLLKKVLLLVEINNNGIARITYNYSTNIPINDICFDSISYRFN